MFSQSATLTSKGQVTIPAKIIKSANLKKGQKLVFHIDGDRIFIETAINMVDRMAGSFPLPEKFKGMDIEDIIRNSKEKHFKNKKQ